MFCPKCGNAEQATKSYCRRCGTFLPDFDEIIKKETSPEQQIRISSTFSFMSAVISLALTILLHILYTGKEGTPFTIYLVIGFLTANFFWQAQSFWRIRKIRKHLPQNRSDQDEKVLPAAEEKLLEEADFRDIVPTSVVENTTVRLKKPTNLS